MDHLEESPSGIWYICVLISLSMDVACKYSDGMC